MPPTGLYLTSAPKPYIFTPDGSMDQWRAAKATGTATILALGDSVLQGNAATSRITGSFWGQIRTALTGAAGGAPTNTPFNHGGDFFTCAASLANDGGFGSPVPWVVNGSPTWAPNGYGRIPLYNPAPAAPIMVFTSLYACTDIDICYLDCGSGSFTYHIDGEAVSARTCTLTNSNQQAKITITGLSSATHTVTFDTQSGTNVMQIMGISTYPTNARRTTGIHFAWMAHGGQSLVTFGPMSPGGSGYGAYDPMAVFAGRYAGVVTGVTNASPPVVTITPINGPIPALGTQISFTGIGGATGINMSSPTMSHVNPLYKISAISGNNYTIQNLDGTNPGAPGAYTSGGFAWFHSGFGFPVNPDLIIMELTGAADALNGFGIEAFTECYRRIWAAFDRGRRPNPMPSVIATITAVESRGTPDNPYLFTNEQVYHQYFKVARDTYDQYGFAFLDIMTLFGQGPTINGYINPGDVHPNNAGHTYLFNQYMKII